MSRLLVVTRPSQVSGFQLAGVDAYAAEDIETAQELISTWLDSDEVNFLAIDSELLVHMPPAFIKRMDSAENLPYLSIPGGQPAGEEISRTRRIATIIQRAIGVHITFKGEETEAEE